MQHHPGISVVAIDVKKHPALANMSAKYRPLKDVELELRAAWECLQRCEASYTARLDAAEAAVRETTRSAQVRASLG